MKDAVGVGPASARPSTTLASADREVGHAARVTARRRVARLDGLDAGLHEPLEELADLLVEDRRLERDAGLRREHRRAAPRCARRRGPPARRRRPWLASFVAGVALLVDELDDADDLVALADERDGEHRPREVADAPVEAGVEVEGRPRGQLVDVGDVERRASAARRAGDRPVRQRHRELARVEGHAVVLRELEAEHRACPARWGAARRCRCSPRRRR